MKEQRMGSEKSHQIIARKLVREIYSGKWLPGDKLPPLRELSKIFNVDQTSLRIALKHLEFLHVLEIKRSDGVYVQDFRKKAGIEFLLSLFPESSEEEISDHFTLMDEFFEFWIAVSPELIRLSYRRYGIRDIREMLNIYEEELNSLEDIDKLVLYEMRLVEILSHVANNLVMTLILNSIRPLQEKMIPFFIRGIGKIEFEKYILLRKKMMKGILDRDEGGLDLSLKYYKESMLGYRNLIREKISESL
ncbi:MAG: FadR family transcriptional regulator [Leptospiraceae bacterium]|nr:FadR family transcriptional regulator [Leptospiraceae bacterium]MCP5512816.1 FadR family transcriptional regulator [Leptospiraceae bacterium]